MKVLCLVTALIFATLGMAFANNSIDRIADARNVFEDIMAAPGGGIPHELLQTARCIVIVPSIQGAGLVFGDRYGLGVALCRGETGWTAPSNIRIEAGRFARQIVQGDSSLILLVMSDRAAYRLIRSPLTLGSEGAVVAGPVGWDSIVDFGVLECANIEVIAYGRVNGIYIDMALDGALLRPANDLNQTTYGEKILQEDILTGRIPVPRTAAPLVSTVTQYSNGVF